MNRKFCDLCQRDIDDESCKSIPYDLSSRMAHVCERCEVRVREGDNILSHKLACIVLGPPPQPVRPGRFDLPPGVNFG